MKTKDQTLLEEAYQKVVESRYKDSWVDHITDFKDRQAYIGLMKMSEHAYKESRRMKDFKRAAKIKLGDQYRDQANDIVRKYIPNFGRE